MLLRGTAYFWLLQCSLVAFRPASAATNKACERNTACPLQGSRQPVPF